MSGYIDYLVFVIISTGLFALFALGLNLQWGFAGLINFGHVGFMTIGAYTTVLLSANGWPVSIAVVIGIMLAAILGFLIGTTTVKLREDYLAIVTIGVSELIRLVSLNEQWLTKGPFGVQNYPIPLNTPPLGTFEPNLFDKIIMIALLSLVAAFAFRQLGLWLYAGWQEYLQIKNKSYKPLGKMGLIVWGIIGFSLIALVYVVGVLGLYDYSDKAGLMLLILIALAFVYWLLESLVRSPWGRVLKSIREDEQIPKALGKNVFWYKLQALMLGGAIAGFAGAFYAWQLTTVYPTNFETIVTFNAWIMVVVGGAGRNAGVILGSVIFSAYESITRFGLQKLDIDDAQAGAFRLMVIGLILMILMVWRPQGILGRKEELTLGK